MTKDEIASFILDRFRTTNSKPNHVIEQKWLNFNLIDKLNPKQQLQYEPAVADLVSEELITIEDRFGPCLVLTQKGFDKIYPVDKDFIKNKIKDKVLDGFRRQNSKPNHSLDQRWINHSLLNELNPKEIAFVDDVIKDLVEDELITTADRFGFCLVLTEKGFDKIY